MNFAPRSVVSALRAGKSVSSVNLTELMAPVGLADQVLGSPNAPIGIVEYASLGCPTCRLFHQETLPRLQPYIRVGLVRFVLREFPLDAVAAGAAVLARSAPPGTFFSVVDLLFERQTTWAAPGRRLDGFFETATLAGFSEESICASLIDDDLVKSVLAVKRRGKDRFDVRSTPTFFVNGIRHRGGFSPDLLDALWGGE